MPNRLAEEASPYLLQHKDNPVDWLPWGEEAFERARREDKPVFLSVGYSSCHWCHVMAHESFEDEEAASLLNRGFVSVKVDREERPDVDEAYMTAVQLQSGRGGWPMSVFLTPDGAPFFAGTYFPREQFVNILRQLEGMWKARRDEVVSAAAEFRSSLEEAVSRDAPKAFRGLDWDFVEEAFGRLAADFDSANGGFGGAPKFPPHSAIELCLALASASSVPDSVRERAKEMALLTLEKMCLGGVRDHVGGGFHRYSTDEVWLLPHFEKMLYDNALLLGNLARALPLASPSQAPLLRSALEGTVRWLSSGMVGPEGLLCSAVDADSEGEEGRFYVWTASEVRDLLGERAEAFLEAYQFEEEGNFRDEATRRKTGANIPHLRSLPARSFEEELAVLRAARSRREKPLRDDKALIGWNGLAIAGLAAAGSDLAGSLLERVFEFWPEGEAMPHLVARGGASGIAYLEDVAGLFWGAVSLNPPPGSHSLTDLPHKGGGGSLAGQVERLLDEASHFADAANGGFFSTSNRHEELFGRSKPYFDQPIPSANALMARSLVRLGRLEEAREVIESGLGWIERAPGAAEALLLAAVEYLVASGEGADAAPKPELKPGEIVAVSLQPSVWRRDEDGWARGEVVLAIREGFHVNTNDPPARWLKPTILRFEGVEAAVDYPKGENDRYEGTVAIPVRVRGAGEFEVTVTAQPCSETECLAEVEKRIALTLA